MTEERIENSAKAVVVQDGRVLLLRYNDTSDFGLGIWYSLPGGRQQFGETLSECLVRECKEELGADVLVGDLLFVREYIHSRHPLKDKGRNQHKVEFMYTCTLASDLAIGFGGDPDQEAPEWISLGLLESLSVFPTDLKRLGGLLAESGPTYWGDTF